MKNNFIPFVKKESLHLLRDTRTLLIVIFIPVVLIVLFGFAISTEVNNVNVAVVAPKHTEEINNAVNRLAANEYFTFKGYISQTEIDETLRSGKVNAVVVFDSDFDRLVAQISAGVPSPPAIQLILDAADANTAMAATAYLQGVLLGTASLQEMFETRMLFNAQMKSAYNFVPGILGLIIILVCAIMTSVSIVREKEAGTMEVLLVSPVRPVKIMFAKMIPYFVISCIILGVILVLSRYLLDVPMVSGVGGIIAISLIYIALSLALGLLISTFSKTQIAALLFAGMVMIVPILMLSGIMFPIENLPKFFQWISNVIPTRWYIEAIRKLMIQGVPFIAVWKEFAILTGMGIVFMGISLNSFNDKLE
ncbi:MAG: ABC transporter permease [Candidatus Cryptobacteroides sp.]